MREILFRGKRISNGEWVDGHYIHRSRFYGDDADEHFILAGGEFHCDFYDDYQVDPETVGQYTGLTDKNGKKIFEGDILKEDGIIVSGEIQIPDHIYEVSMRKGCWCVIGVNFFDEWDFLYTNSKKCEIIGNIHDNPELLEA